jgi:hypothetical protein
VLIFELLEKIPPRTRDRVTDANKRHGTAIREAIRGELRFKAQWTDPETQQQYASQCPVETDQIGFPDFIARVDIPQKAEFAARLAPLLPTLTRLVVAGDQGPGSEGRIGTVLHGASRPAATPSGGGF